MDGEVTTAVKEAAGTLLYRYVDSELQVLLVHPSGAYNRNSPWSIPKGEANPNERDSAQQVDWEAVARRETLEETGLAPCKLLPLGLVDYSKTRKRVYCFTGPAPTETEPFAASWEVDQCQFFPITRALRLIHPDQRRFLVGLRDHLARELGLERR